MSMRVVCTVHTYCRYRINRIRQHYDDLMSIFHTRIQPASSPAPTRVLPDPCPPSANGDVDLTSLNESEYYIERACAGSRFTITLFRTQHKTANPPSHVQNNRRSVSIVCTRLDMHHECLNGSSGVVSHSNGLREKGIYEYDSLNRQATSNKQQATSKK